MEEVRAEKQVATVMQKVLEQEGSHGRKFFYAMSRSALNLLLGVLPVLACLNSIARAYLDLDVVFTAYQLYVN